MEELEYITDNALIMCDQGGAPAFFKSTFNKKVKIHGCLVATAQDAVPIMNIPSFKVCKINGGACLPATAPLTWKDTYQVKVNGFKTLVGKSTCQCSLGGKIEFMTSGQIPLPDEAMQEVLDKQAEAQRELDDSGNGDSVGEAGFVEGMIPVWGSGRDLINDIQTGDTLGAVLNAGFLIWDVASIAVGVVSFGAGTAAMQGAKAGLKGSIKAGAKAIGKKVLEKLGIASFKELNKQALKNSIDAVAKKLLKTCVFACFPAGTPIHTETGLKNIEDIEVGELIWSYDEETETISLQPVVDIIENETDHTVELYISNEVIETTASHPFYTEEGWKDASELNEEDKVLDKEHKWQQVKGQNFLYQKKKVYNLTVANFHTYFVGLLAFLVHNAQRCLSQMMLESQKWFQNIMRGHSFNNVMNAFTELLATEKGKKFFSELFVKLAKGGNGRIDSLIEGVAMIERKATKLAEITIETAKSYINDAAKYADAIYTMDGEVKKITEQVYLHIDEIGKNTDKVKEILEYAKKKNVTIIDDISQIIF